MVVLAVLAAGVHSMTITAPALAEQERAAREAEAAAERSIVPNPAATEGLPVPALIGGIVLAFAVGLSAGHVQRRRRVARRQEALSRPAPVPDPPLPLRPAPPPPEPAAPAPPRPVDIAPAPARPAPPPPEPPKVVTPPPAEPAETPEIVTPEPRDIVAPAPEPVAEAAPEPPEIVAPAPEPVAEAAPEPREVVVPPPTPLLKPPGRVRRPAFGSVRPVEGAPEVPRPEGAGPGRAGPAAPLGSAPEALGLPPRRKQSVPPVEPEALPGRRFARSRPWPQEAESLWTCEIGWKAGYVKSTFRALAAPPGGEGRKRPIGESPSLRWTLMTDPEPPTPEMTASVRALMSALVAAGWERTEPGGAWYAQRFLWRGDGEPGPVTVPQPAEPAEPPSR